MKNIVLMMLVGLLPFLTMAQKRSKKEKNVKIEKVVASNPSYEFMIITGYEVFEFDANDNRAGAVNPELRAKQMMKSNSRIRIMFDFGLVKPRVISELLKKQESLRTMASAVNAAAKEGWNFVSSDVSSSKNTRVHYYYMKRDK
jgi:hypothetical protein